MACWAALVMASASSRMTSLWLPGGRLTFFFAKDLMRSRTTSIPRSSDAFSSRTASVVAGPRSWRARHSIDVVFPVPGGPDRITFGKFPVLAMALNFEMASSFPTTSSSVRGRYFSTQGTFFLLDDKASDDDTTASSAGAAAAAGVSKTAINNNNLCEPLNEQNKEREQQAPFVRWSERESTARSRAFASSRRIKKKALRRPFALITIDLKRGGLVRRRHFLGLTH
mmetsp:Transcript_7222/g.23720  ORF Transcript_7222/g.23720 Transcript_7222/m.23720 type:complete len:226 (+) Transcript_7222:219-896(+)